MSKALIIQDRWLPKAPSMPPSLARDITRVSKLPIKILPPLMSFKKALLLRRLQLLPTAPVVMHGTGSSLCPSNNGVTVKSVKAENNKIVPTDLDPSSIFYELNFTGTEAAPEVTFKLDSPFSFDVGMYIQYSEKVSGSSSGALDPACIGNPVEPGCNPSATSVAAGCIKKPNGEAFAFWSAYSL